MILHTIGSLLLLCTTLAAAPVSQLEVPAEGSLPARIKTAAVISGSNKRVSVFAAERLDQGLARDSSLQVLSPSDVSRKLATYPYDIRGPFRSSYFNTTVDYDNTDIAALRRIKEHLGVDYLYVVWQSEASTNSFGQSKLGFLTQLFVGPAGSLEDNDGFYSSAWGGINCCLSFTAPGSEHQQRNLEEACDEYARYMAGKLDSLEKAARK